MRIAYGKLGRSIPLDLANASSHGGDAEVIRLLDSLLVAGHEVHLVGRNQADRTHPRLVNHWVEGGAFGKVPSISDKHVSGIQFHDAPEYQAMLETAKRGAERLPKFDAWLLWIGPHGAISYCIPPIRGTALTRPFVSLVNYVYPIIGTLNQLDVVPRWLSPDPRNMVRMRDLANPNQRPILAQYNTTKPNTFYDPRDGQIRPGKTDYFYSGIELLALPRELPPLDLTTERFRFGALINEGYGPKLTALPRRDLVKQWLTPLDGELFGHWSEEGQAHIGRTVQPIPLEHVQAVTKRWQCTLTLPATSTGWATAKPWESFAAGTLCFRHPGYDNQDHIYGKHMSAELRQFLSVTNEAELIGRVSSLTDLEWRHFAQLQRAYLEASRERLENGMKHVWEVIR